MNRLVFAARHAAGYFSIVRPGVALPLALFAAVFVLLGLPAAQAQARGGANTAPPTVAIGSGVDVTYTFELTEVESVYAVQIDPGFTDFTIKDTSGCPIDPTGRTNTSEGTNCVIVVHFQPTAPGLRTAPLRIEATTGTIAVPAIGYGDGPQGVVYPGGDSVFLGIFGMPGFNGDNFTQYKELNAPSAIAFDSGSRLYFADPGNFRIRRVSTTTSTLETVAGNGTAGFSGDGGPSTSAEIGATIPGIALDGQQNIFIVDQANFRIREIGTYLDGFAAPTIDTIVGSGTQASATGCAHLGPPTTPSFNTLYGIAVDLNGDVFFSDAGTGCIYRRQGIGDTMGNITLIAGNGTKTSTGDGGPSTSATFISPGALALDEQQQYLYVIDMGDYTDQSGVHHGKNIRKINLQTGIVTAAAGNGGAFNTYAGDGGPATAANFNTPNGLVLDAANNLYVTESAYIRRIDAATGTITTVAGNASFNGLSQISSGGLHFAAAPFGIALDNQGSYYFLEPTESVIKKIDLTVPYLGFNSTAIGSASVDSPQTLYLSNIGTQPLTVTGPAPVVSSVNYILSPTSPVTTYVPCVTTTQSTTAITLATGATCASTVSFIPSTQDSNNESAIFTDNSLNTVGGLAQPMGLDGESFGTPSTGTLLPSPVDFGSVNTGATSSKTITFTNTGTASLTYFSAALSNSAFTQTNNCPSSLAIGASCTFTVVFAPTATGAQSATLTVNSTIVGGSTASLTGTGAAAVTTAPQAALTPSATFGSVQIGGSATQMLTLTNAGNAALPITSYMVTTGATQFSVTASTCTSSLAAGGSCTYTITFNPTTAGAQTGTFAVTDSIGTQTASLSGTAAAAPTPQAALTPATASFSSLTVGTTSTPQTFQLSNAGNATLPITSITVTSGSPFTIATNTCTTSLAAGSSCQISITFKPTATGSASATLTVVDSVGTQTSSLSGTGTSTVAADFTLAATPAAQSSYLGSTVTYAIQLASSSAANSFTNSVTLSVTGLPTGATATFAPAAATPGAAGATSTLTVSTPPQLSENSQPIRSAAIAAAGLLGLLTFGLRRRRLSSLLLIAALSLAAVAASGCSAGGTGFAVPISTSTLVITGTSGAITHSANVSLTLK